MRILAIETATRAGSVAVLDGDRAVQEEVELRGRGVVPVVADVLAREGMDARSLDAVAVSVGPGSFTGVRIGVAAAQGLCLATGVPAVAVGTLEGLAWTAPGTEWGVEGTLLLASVDARRAEVYAALYRVAASGRAPEFLWGPEPVSCVAMAARLAEMSPGEGECPGVLVGDGAALLLPLFPPDAGWAAPGLLSRPAAGAVARAAVPRVEAGRILRPEELEPVYLRKSDAEIHREERLRQD